MSPGVEAMHPGGIVHHQIRRGREPSLARIHLVVPEWLVADRRAAARCCADHADRLGHLERRENACPNALAPRTAVEFLGQQPENAEARIAVVKVFARFEALYDPRIGVAEKDAQVVGQS